MASTSSAQASVGFLSAADDLLTKLLLDYSIFNEPRLDGRATGKMMRFARELRMSDKEVASARELVDKLRQGVVSVPDGLETLLALPCVKTFNQKWDDEPLFAHHAKRYIIALRPDSGIAFHETDRYKNPRGLSKSRPMPPPVAAKLRRDPSTFIEVGVFATRAFKKGEVVNLRGGIADLTEEEDDEMRDEGGRSDFSVLWSQRKECFCLLLGPARFVNHDCRNNVEFQLTGTNMAFKVLEDVAKDEELFTHYGEHYFEHDNASCLCATCEQLKQGAFAPARPKVVAAPKPRASSPTPASRRSRRASTIAAPDYNEARSSTSASAAAAATAPRAGRAAGLSRSASTPTLSRGAPARPRPRSSRMNPTRGELSPAEALRGQPRLIVQPKLAPPPGYARDYEWDAKKRIARYKGPKTSSVSENAASSKADPKCKLDSAPASSASTSTAPVAPAKRGRPRSSTATANDSSPAPSAASSPRKAKKPRVSQVVLKQVRVGERSSKRQAALGKEPAGARGRAESTKLRQVTALAHADEAADSSELSEAEDGDEDEAMEEAAAVEAQEDDEVEAMLSPARQARRASSSMPAPASPLPFAMPASTRHRAESSTSVTLSAAPTRSSRSLTSDTSASAAASSTVALRSVACDVGMSTSTPIEESHSPQLRGASLEDDLEDDKDAFPGRKGKGIGESAPEDEPAAAREPISAPASGFYGVGVGSAASDSGGGAGAGAGAASQQQDFRSGPSQEGGPRNTSRLAAGSSSGIGGGDGGGGGGGDDGDGRRPGAGRIPVDMMDEEEEEKPKTGKEEDDEQEQGKGGAVAPSGEVQAASEGAPAVEEEGRARVPPSDPEDAAAALLMLLCAPPQPQTPSSTAPTPPHAADSVHPSATTSASTSASGEASLSRPNVRRGRTSNESRPSPGPSLNPRSTRRHSKLPEPSEPSAPEPGFSTATSASASQKGKKKARVVEPDPASSASERRRSTTRSGAAAAASAASPPGLPPSLEARRTRSQPLPGKLADVLYAPETLAATGGYDYEKGRYISKFEATRDPSHNPLPPRRPSPTPDPTPSPPPPPPPARKVAAVAKTTRPPTRSAVVAVAAPSTPRAAPAASTCRPPSQSSGSSAQAPAAIPSSAPPEGVRSTRRSFPIAGPLRDLIYSPAAIAANGGWDAAAGKYVSAGSASSTASPAPLARRASSASVEGGPASSSSRRKRPGSPSEATTSSSAPPADVRSTRRSFPMAGTRMADLVYSPAARLVSGGWDPALGRYVSAAKGEPSTGSRTGGAAPHRLG